MKVILFDSGTLITLSMNDLIDMLRELKKIFNGKFIITKEVEQEIIKKPLTIKKFKLGALRLKKLVDDRVLEFPDSLGINQNDVSRMTTEIMNFSNEVFVTKGRPLHIIDLGESSILALSKLLRNKGIDSLIAMDERTTRMLCEKPENLRSLLEGKLHSKVQQVKSHDKEFNKFEFIRSTELIYVAFKKDIFDDKSKEMLDALLYGAKFKGAAISSDEIKIMERM